MTTYSDWNSLESYLMDQETTRIINENARIANENKRLEGFDDMIKNAIIDAGIKYADPIEWSNNKQYERATVVTYLSNGYISKQAVPAGIPPTNSTYWLSLSGDGSLVAQETEARKKAINDEVLARNAAIATAKSDLSTLISSEETTRVAKDSELEASIANEVVNRNTAIAESKTLTLATVDTRIEQAKTNVKAYTDTKLGEYASKDAKSRCWMFYPNDNYEPDSNAGTLVGGSTGWRQCELCNHQGDCSEYINHGLDSFLYVIKPGYYRIFVKITTCANNSTTTVYSTQEVSACAGSSSKQLVNGNAILSTFRQSASGCGVIKVTQSMVDSGFKIGLYMHTAYGSWTLYTKSRDTCMVVEYVGGLE